MIWWQDEKPRREEVGVFTRDRPLEELEALLRDAASKLAPRT